MEKLNYAASIIRIAQLLGSDDFKVNYAANKTLLKNDETKILLRYKDHDWVFCRIECCVVPDNKFDYNNLKFVQH